MLVQVLAVVSVKVLAEVLDLVSAFDLVLEWVSPWMFDLVLAVMLELVSVQMFNLAAVLN